ncbi:LamG domain-containing protein [Streptomyces sp. NPDC127098]|uniref:LamG domain-containing protein n=1 Tax=Streptomyces sp. NPDC127098 TaxID=3347137 RepID=UPI003667DC25
MVELTTERTEYSTTYANPDGSTFTLDLATAPVRVAGSDGSWTEPDATLVAHPDGTVGPRAAVADLAFSGGGADGPMVSIGEGGRSLAIGWPAGLPPLPEPDLSGATARYADVLPDVDLLLTADLEGFDQVLVVRTPEAAANPLLRELEFDVGAQGLAVRESAAGALTAVDPDGNAVLQAPPAHMWDSAGGDQATVPTVAAPNEPTAANESGDAAADRTQQPAPGDTIADLDVTVDDGTLRLIPDSGMLTGTPDEAFPLYIDPSWGIDSSRRTLLRSDGYESYGWDNGDDNEGKGTGECGTWSGYYCGSGYRQRLYFQFAPNDLAGKNILQATFRATQSWSFVCDPRTVDLVRTNGFSASTSWPGPSRLGTMASRNVNHGRGSACSPSSPAAPVEFTSNTLTSTVRSFAEGGFSSLSLMLQARSESDTSYWKRFRNNAVLSVTYVALPAKPTNVGVVSGNGIVCDHSSSDPLIVSDPTPALTATVREVTGGRLALTGRAVFDVDRRNADGSWSNTIATHPERPSSGYVGHNTRMTIDWPVTLAEDTLYRYRAYNRSYWVWDGTTHFRSGPNTQDSPGWCYFKVDRSAPLAPGIDVAGPYDECLPNDCPAGGGPGTRAALTFSRAAGDDPINAVQYRLNGETTWRNATASGGNWTASITPQSSGTRRVYARARDEVGRWGAQGVFDFLVARGEGPVGRWHLAEASGTAADSAGSGHSATLYGDAIRDDRGRRGVITRDATGAPLAEPQLDRGLALDGAGDYARTSGPVLETRAAYTLSAWVWLDETADETGIVLSQDGQNYSPFIVAHDRGRWLFGIKEQDAATGQAYFGRVAPAQAGVWTHLAGTYDPATQELYFYVNGRLAGAVTLTTGSWSATGPLQIGRYQWAGIYQHYFRGVIDEVAVWQRVLTAEEIAQEARLLTSEGYAGAELVAAWDPSMAADGTVLSDGGTGYDRDLSLQGGAMLEDDALVLDGTTGAGGTPGPIVDDTGSFTVTAVAEPDGAALADRPAGYVAQVAGQRTADGSAWGLWFELTGTTQVIDDNGDLRTVPVGLWHFGRLAANGEFTSVHSDQPAPVEGDVRLTGVHNAQDGTISLTLGEITAGDPLAFTAVAGSGDFAVGRGVTSGSWEHYLPGRVTDVRVWSGAMASPQQIADTAAT